MIEQHPCPECGDSGCVPDGQHPPTPIPCPECVPDEIKAQRDMLRCKVASLEAALDTAQAEAARCEGLAYVPGYSQCTTCGFHLVSNVIDASFGRIGVDLNAEPEPCPNDGTTMRLVSWKQRCLESEAMLNHGVAEIAGERKRQIEEGWTPEHDDDTHCSGELASAAVVLTLSCESDVQALDDDEYAPEWAFGLRRKYAYDRRRRLIIAGALIAAEIDRLGRERWAALEHTLNKKAEEE